MDDTSFNRCLSETYAKYVNLFLMQTKYSFLKWKEINVSSLDFEVDKKALRVFQAQLLNLSYYLLKTSDKDPQLCIREKDWNNYPYKFITKSADKKPLIIDIKKVNPSSIIQEFYDVVETAIDEERQKAQEKQLHEYINILKGTDILKEKEGGPDADSFNEIVKELQTEENNSEDN